MTKQDEYIWANGRQYARPGAPVVVVCIDGSEPAYHEKAVEAGLMPFLEKVISSHTALDSECAMPSFTNPNNLSIATGAPPAVHGITGNYFYDDETGREVLMNDPRFLRAPTIFAELDKAGVPVAVVTAKDKLRALLGAGLDSGVCFSAERADEATDEQNGISGVLDLVGKPVPEVYSAELSEFVLAAGVALLEQRRPKVMYLSLTDYVQHKYAPGSPEANAFYQMMDGYFARLDELGAVLVVTADHGMKAKCDDSGSPSVLYLTPHLDEWLGVGSARVVLPITDPYTAHHGALGSFATVHLPPGADRDDIADRLRALPGVDLVLTREAAADRFELPADRIGDLVVVGESHVALGVTEQWHDLSQLDRPLRSHGGLTEQVVPFIVNRTIAQLPEGHRLRNFDAYWVALNRVYDHRGGPSHD